MGLSAWHAFCSYLMGGVRLSGGIMRRFNVMIPFGMLLALVVGGSQIASAQLTGSVPKVNISNTTVSDTTTGSGRPSDSRGSGGTTTVDESARKKAERDKLAAEVAAKKQREAEEAAKKKADQEQKAAALAKLAAEKAAAEAKAKVEQAAKEAAAKRAAEEQKIAQEKIAAANAKLAAEAKAKIEAEKVIAAKLAAEKAAAEKEAARKAAADAKIAADNAAAEKARLEKIAAEKAAVEKLKAEQQLKAESERKLKEVAAKSEAERVAKEAAAKKAAEDQRIAQEKAAAEKVRAEKLAAEEKVRTDKIAAEKVAAERARQEKISVENAVVEKPRLEKILAEKEAARKAAEQKAAADAKIAADKAAAEKARLEKIATEKAAAEKLKAEQQLKAESERKLKEAAAKAEAERVAKEAAAKKAAEDQRIAQEKVVAEKVRAEKLAVAEKIRLDKIAAEQAAAEKIRLEKIAAEKAAAEKVRAEQQAKADAERVAKEAAAKRAAEEQRIAQEKAAAEKVRAEKLAAEEKVRADKIAAEKVAAERARQEKIAAENAAAEKARLEKIAAEKVRAEQQAKAEAERIAKEEAAKKAAEAERVAKEAAAKKAAEEQRIAQEKAAAEKVRAEKLAAEEKVRADKIAAEKVVAERVRQEKIAAENAAAESARLARETEAKAEAERVAQERETAKRAAEEQRLAQERADAARAAAEREAAQKVAEEQRLAREKLAAEKVAAEKERASRLSQIEAERKAREEVVPKVEREVVDVKIADEKKSERRVEDLPPIDPKNYREIEVNERRRTVVQDVEREIQDKDNRRRDVVVADSRKREVMTTLPEEKKVEDVDNRERCRDREFFRAHLETCQVKLDKLDTDRRIASTLRAVRDSRCTSGDAVLQSKSSIFDVANAKVMDLPKTFAASKLQKPLIVESKDATLRQYILIPIAEDGRLDALAIDPVKGVVRVLNLGQFSAVHLLNSANGVADVLVLSNDSGVKFLANSFSVIDAKMKDATPIEQLQAQTAVDLVDPNSSELKSIVLPSGGQILTVHSYDKSLVIVRGDEKEKSAQDVVFLKSVADANAKVIPLNDLKGFMYRGALLASNGNQLEMAMITMKNDGGNMTTFHANDLLADNVVFEKTEMVDANQANEKLKKIEGKSEVKKSEKSIKTKVADKDKFEQMLADAVSAKKVAGVAVTHPFEDFGTSSNAIVFKDAGFGFVKMGSVGIEEKEDELIVPQENGAACAISGDAVAVDIDSAGGKDVAVMVVTDDAASLVFYPNINQVQKFISVTAEAKPEGIQLNQQSVTEENETIKCHWEAYQKMTDGSLKDVSTQLNNPNVCNPIFNPTAPTLTSLVQWLVDQLMPSAYAADATSTEYIFRVTTTDPLGLQATAEATATVTKAVADAPPIVKVVDAEVLTPTQTEAVATQVVEKAAPPAVESGARVTVADVGMAATAPLIASAETEGAKSAAAVVAAEVVPNSPMLSMQGGFGCSLIRPEESSSTAPMKVRGEVSDAPGFFARIRSAIAKAVNTTIAAIGNFFQNFGGKVRSPETAAAVASGSGSETIKVTAAPIVMAASEVQQTILVPTPSVPAQPTSEERVLSTITPVVPAQSPMMHAATLPTTIAPMPVVPSIAPPSVITIKSNLAPAVVAPPVTQTPAAAVLPTSLSKAAETSGASAPIASRDVLNLKSVEVPPASVASSAPVVASEHPTSIVSPAPATGLAPSRPTVPASSSLTPMASPTSVASGRSTPAPVTSSIPLTPLTALPTPSAPAPVVASRPVVAEPAPVVARPVITETAVRSTPIDVAPTAPLAAALPETRPTTIAVRPEVSCNDLSFVMANRNTCRCAVRESSLGNILPQVEATRDAHAVSIENGKVLFNPSLFLRDALNCAVDPALPQPVAVPSFELPQPRFRGAERDLLVANAFVTPDGRIFGIAVDDAEGRRVRGLAVWDVGNTAAATMLNFKPFPEFLQLSEAVRGMGITSDAATGKTAIDITLITSRGAQESHHCDLGRDDVLTCIAPTPVPEPAPSR